MHYFSEDDKKSVAFIASSSKDEGKALETDSWLTVEIVEDLQRAVQDGRSINAFVKALKGATLPGIVEYGCLRWANPGQVPPLPATIENTDLGRALAEVTSELGLRTSGPQKGVIREIYCRSHEFIVLKAEKNKEEEAWKTFEIRFSRSVEDAGFSRSQSNYLHGALTEMVDNALFHAYAPIPVLVGYQSSAGLAQFCVADVGIGVMASLHRCSKHQSIELHKDAIRKALHDGVSGDPNGGGFGFRTVFKALISYYGLLRFRSGEGCVSMDGANLDADQGVQSCPPFLPGFQVTVSCRIDDRPVSVPLL